MGFFTSIAPVIGGIAGFALGGPAGAAIGAGLGGSIAGADAQKDGLNAAANASNASTNAQIAEQRRQYDLSRQDFSPFLQPSSRALATLQSALYGGQFGYKDPSGKDQMATWQPQESEGFQYTKNRTLKDLSRSLRAMGRSNSTYGMNAMGETIGRLNADNEATQRNELWNLVKSGQGAAGNVSSLGANTANQITGALANQGATLANIANLKGQTNANMWSGIGNAPMSLYSLYKGGAF